jgi:hypothetical protein
VTRLGKLLRLEREDRLLLVEAATLLATIRVALVFVPFTRLRRSLARISARRPRRRALRPVHAAWAVDVASRYVPGTRHCLTQALAGQLMLARSGVPAHLRIGLARSDQGRLHGHAWLESEGTILIGGAEAGEYKELESFRGRVHE